MQKFSFLFPFSVFVCPARTDHFEFSMTNIFNIIIMRKISVKRIFIQLNLKVKRWRCSLQVSLICIIFRHCSYKHFMTVNEWAFFIIVFLFVDVFVVLADKYPKVFLQWIFFLFSLCSQSPIIKIEVKMVYQSHVDANKKRL